MMRARYYRSIDHIHHTFTPAGDCQSLTVSGGGSCFSPSQGKNVSVCFAFLRKGNSKNHSVSYFGMIYIFWRSCIIKIKWCWNAYGTPDMEFAINGLLARSLLAAGQSEDAYRTIESLREKFAEEGRERFLPNMDAMLVRISLHTGDLDCADTWYREKAPRDPMRVNVMKR